MIHRFFETYRLAATTSRCHPDSACPTSSPASSEESVTASVPSAPSEPSVTSPGLPATSVNCHPHSSYSNRSLASSIQLVSCPPVAPVLSSSRHLINRSKSLSRSTGLPTASSHIQTSISDWFGVVRKAVPSPLADSTVKTSRPSASQQGSLHQCQSEVSGNYKELNEPPRVGSGGHPTHLSQWGDTLPKLDQATTLRVVYQNVHHSLRPQRQAPSTLDLISNLHALQCGIFCASETNVNWSNPPCLATIKPSFQKTFRQVHTSTTCSKLLGKELSTSLYLPGGAAVFTLAQWSPRVMEHGKDENGIGRWAYTTIQGKNHNCLTIICEYRPCPQGPHAGPLTVHSQHVLQLSELQLQTQQDIVTPVPWEEFIKDLKSFIVTLQQKGNDILLCMDANEAPSACHTSTGLRRWSIDWLLEETGLMEVFTSRHREFPPSTMTTPNRVIDRVTIWNLPLLRVTSLAVHNPAHSDHLGTAVDIDLHEFFGGTRGTLSQAAPQKLSVLNRQSRITYEKLLLRQILEHKILERAKDLYQQAGERPFTAEDNISLNQLDKQLTEILLSCENQCSPKTVTLDPWSPSLRQAGRMVVYWRARLTQCRTGASTTEHLESLRAWANSHCYEEETALRPIRLFFWCSRQDCFLSRLISSWLAYRSHMTKLCRFR